jgi:hypothetical protein
MKKLVLSKYFIFISVLTFITIFVFMVSKSYDNYMGPIKQAKGNVLLKPIDPGLDPTILKEIESRLDIKYDSSAGTATSEATLQP